MSYDNTGAGTEEWHEARFEALAVLRDALEWNLSAPRWELMQDTIAGMAQAVTTGSARALWQTTGRLELYSPERVATRLGDAAMLPAPMLVRERIAELIDALTQVGNLKAGDEPGLDRAPQS